MTAARMEAIRKRILADKSSDEGAFNSGAFFDTINKMSLEHMEPLYVAPSDIIDEFGRLKLDYTSSFQLPKHLQTAGPESLPKIAFYMKKRFPERLLQARELAAASEQVYTAWRSRTRKREAEWGDPEDLGLLPAHTINTSGNSNADYAAYGANKTGSSGGGLVRLGEDKMAPKYPQLAVQPKQLLSSYFIDSSSFTAASRKLFHSARPSLLPANPTSRFNANTAVWSPAERKTFIELYLQNPKNFAKIATQLPYKNCEQCVEFYYRHKKEYRLKQMVASYRKAMVAQRKLILNPNNSINNSNTSNNNNNNNNNNNASPLSNLNILPVSGNGNHADEDSGSGSNASGSTSRKKTGRPVGRPKNKDKQK